LTTQKPKPSNRSKMTMPATIAPVLAVSALLPISIAMLQALGGPSLTETDLFAKKGYSVGERPSRVLSDSFTAFSEIENVIRNDASLHFQAD
jgi:hypothetical protein